MVQGTSNCVKCGKPAILYGGHVIGRQKMALGNLIEVKIIAGWCSDECYNSIESENNGCYGQYDNVTMGNVKNIY